MMSWHIHRCVAQVPQKTLCTTYTNSPQFEVVFSDSQIPESEALSLVESAHPTYDAEFSSQTELSSQTVQSSPADTADDDSIISLTYELVSLPPHTYLCSIPVLAPPSPPNQTATELFKAEEARELARASIAGWEIINALDGHCLYFMSGWWSYSFCYNRDIVQFHALPNGLKSGAPPVRDPQSAEYVLGRVHYDTHRQSQPGTEGDDDTTTTTTGSVKELPAPPNSELAVKDNQRYLVQRLDGGTLCDLTGRERTIEVQYHCHPGIPGDRIGWIKEVTTCTYLMVVQTPRLCADAAFLPPKEARAHAVTCRRVGNGKEGGGGEGGWFGLAGREVGEGVASAAGQAAGVILSAAGAGGKEEKAEAGESKSAGVTIGGVLVGGRKMLGTGADGTPAARVPPPRHLSGGRGGGGGGGGAGAVVEVLAKGHSKAEGGQVEVLTREELEKLDLSADAIEELKRELQKLAGDNGWKLEVVEVPGEGAEIRGIVEGPDDGEEEGKEGGLKKEGGGKGDNDRDIKAEKTRHKMKKPDDGQNDKGDRDQEGGEEEGSEEVFFRDEL